MKAPWMVPCLGLLLVPSALAAEQRSMAQLRVASLAPEGSAWISGAQQVGADLRRASEGQAGLRLYPGGVQGDDLEIVAKLEEGRLQGALLSGVGLGKLVPAARRLELPFLMADQATAHRVRDALAPQVEAALREKGLRILTWLDAGAFYLFADRPPQGPDALKGARAWVLPGDVFAERALTSMGLTPVPLPLHAVRGALNEDQLDVVTHLPAACLALQWCSKLSYRLGRPVAFGVGVFVMREDALASLSAPALQALLTSAQAMGPSASAATHAQHKRALDSLASQGIITLDIAPKAAEAFRRAGLEAARAAVGTVYSKEQLAEVLEIVAP